MFEDALSDCFSFRTDGALEFTMGDRAAVFDSTNSFLLEFCMMIFATGTITVHCDSTTMTMPTRAVATVVAPITRLEVVVAVRGRDLTDEGVFTAIY
jgi:hypothetical protein